MNANDSRPERSVADLARLLPVPAERDLPAGRRHLIKEHLMTELRTDQPPRKRPARAPAVPAAQPGPRQVSACWPVLRPCERDRPDRPPRTHPGIGGPTTAAKLLSEIAAAAAKAPAREVTDNQFEYIASEISGGRPYGKPAPAQASRAEVWIPVTDLCRTALTIENGKKYTYRTNQVRIRGRTAPSEVPLPGHRE